MQAWEQFLQLQEAELGTETVQKWLRSLKIQRFDACNLYLEAKDSFQALWFEEHIRGKAQSKLVNGNNKRIKIHLSIANSPQAAKKAKLKAKIKESTSPFQLTFDDLDPLCLFQYFIVSEENTLAHKLFLEIAGLSPQTHTAQLGTFNPIYLYGGGGTGKTHLLMSLAHTLRAQGLKIIYVRAETFTDHVVTAIRAGEMSVFRQAYRNIDVLLVDDVHVFSRKGATQEEFFHTFNTLHLEGKQIILSANCAPQELQLIEPRLVSRFEWGIVLPLKPLKTEDMRLLLNTKAQALHFPLPTKIADFLLETFTSNPKTLIKALEALVLRLHLDSKNTLSSLTTTAAKTLLADLVDEEVKSAITPAKIIQAVAEQYGIRTEDILGKAQTRDCALPRQLAMHLCREQLKMPFMKIGDLFFRDHSTVMSSVKHIQKALDQDDREITGAWHAILKKLQA
ncbi:chromosomal replication initiator protein DnaA [Candidatus Protochlamydia phocaeensis]|uniref:chromosomal replication initiator protein DnaA n=1 Tax=Candidatus Protochlamydia phocaeensis TaxID=1414722 RepID=UPI000837D28D|nr:chromosomal replication initiator protein DnaA [Candidatus Protochlamydia phocaeensis]